MSTEGLLLIFVMKSLQKLLYLICETKLFRDPKITFHDSKWGRDP